MLSWLCDKVGSDSNVVKFDAYLTMGGSGGGGEGSDSNADYNP